MEPHPDFEFLDEIGRGEAAAVYRAREFALKRYVAIKELHKTLRSDPQQMEHFCEEAEFLAGHEHDKIVKIFRIDKERGWIVMELMRGSLDTKLAQGPLSHDLVRSILRQTLEGLKYLHGQGKLHGAIKPANLLINDDGHVRLSDSAGLAPGGVVRKPSAGNQKYLAPEILNPEAFGDVTPAVDLYCLGFTALELLQGANFKNLFTGVGEDAINSDMGWLRWHSSPAERLQPMAKLIPAIPVDLAQVIDRLLEKEVANRYTSAGEALDDLEKLPILPVHLPGDDRKTKTERVGGQSAPVPTTSEEKRVRPKPGDSSKPWSWEWINLKLQDKRILGGVCAAILLPAIVFLFWPTSPPLMTVTITTTPPGAKVIRGNKALEGRNDKYGLAPGKHKLALTLQGYKREEVEINVTKSDESFPFKLKPDIQKVAITSVPSGASIWLDDKDAKQTTDAEMKLAPGKYTIKLILKGYKNKEDDIEVTNDDDAQSFKFKLSLDDKKKPEVVTQGSRIVMITSLPSGADVFLDGQSRGIRTPAKVPLEVGGNYTVTLKKEGYKDTVPTRFTLLPGAGEHQLDPIHLVKVEVVAREGRRAALLVGIRDGRFPESTFAETNVDVLAQVLKRAGYPSNELKILKKDGTAENIRKALRSLTSDKQPEDTLLVVFVAPAVAAAGDACFVPVGGDPQIKGTLLPVSEIYEEMRRCPAGLKLAVFDHGGSAALSGVPPDGVAALLCCDAGQTSYRHLNWRHTVFMQAVIKGLSGQADANQDGRIALNEIKEFVVNAVGGYSRQEYPRQPVQKPILLGSTSPTPAVSTVGTALKHYSRGCQNMDNEKYSAAVKDFTQALGSDSQFVPALLYRAIAHFQQELMNEAVKDCDAAIALDPQNTEAYSIRGEARLELKQKEGALTDLKRAIDFSPEFASPYQTRARVFRELLKDHAKATVDLDIAIKLEPLNYNLWEERGVTYATKENAGKEDYKKAEQDYLKAIDLNPTWYLPYQDLSRLFGRRNETELEKQWLEKSKKVKAGMPPG